MRLCFPEAVFAQFLQFFGDDGFISAEKYRRYSDNSRFFGRFRPQKLHRRVNVLEFLNGERFSEMFPRVYFRSVFHLFGFFAVLVIAPGIALGVGVGDDNIDVFIVEDPIIALSEEPVQKPEYTCSFEQHTDEPKRNDKNRYVQKEQH
jgi:hypothetical protein